VLNNVGLVTPFSSGVTNEAEGMTACPRFSKNFKKRERISVEVSGCCMTKSVAEMGLIF
jgi:hypothetical protein